MERSNGPSHSLNLFSGQRFAEQMFIQTAGGWFSISRWTRSSLIRIPYDPLMEKRVLEFKRTNLANRPPTTNDDHFPFIPFAETYVSRSLGI